LPLDASLDENRGDLPVPYLEQPYWPTAALPDQAGRAMLYVEVWQRELTYVEEQSLEEPAVGVDTGTRWQSVWQVKALANVGDVDCHTPLDEIPGWTALVRPSAGRLSARAVGTPTEEDPCIIPPQGGYRSLENRLYRVEIHDPGDVDTATFKWSRENATVATTVNRINGLDELEVAKAEWDNVRNFAASGWIEITDDHRELNGDPGVLRKIKDVNSAARILVLEEPLVAGEFPTDGQGIPARSTRIRRWDQAGEVRYEHTNTTFDLDGNTSTGAIPLAGAGTRIVLEHGVEVTFTVDDASGEFHTGDYWLFAARSADHSVEELDQVPPVGIHRHYCRIGFVDFDGAQFGAVTDCRPTFPPLTDLHPGCCTIVVEPGEDIQAAINSLPPEGGCICLKTGIHEIGDTLEISGANVVIHGETPQTTIRSEKATRLLRLIGDPVVGISDIRIADLRFESPAIGDIDSGPIIEAASCRKLAIERCYIGTPAQSFMTGVIARQSQGVSVSDCEIKSAIIGIRADERSSDITVNGCSIATDPDVDDADSGIAGVLIAGVDGPCSITNNTIDGFATGISVSQELLGGGVTSNAAGSTIAGNRVSRRSRDNEARSPKLYAIDIAARRCTVSDNTIVLAALGYGGIRAAASFSRVTDNTIVSVSSINDDDAPVGLLLGHEDDQASSVRRSVHVDRNRFSGRLGDGHECTVDANVVGGDQKLPVRQAVLVERSDNVSVTNNRITGAERGILLETGAGNRVEGNRIVNGGDGITANEQSQLTARGNELERLANWGFVATLLTGMTTFADNRVISCGHGRAFAGIATGVIIAFALGEVVVEGNEVTDTGVIGTTTVQPAIGLTVAIVLESRVQGNIISYSNPFASRDLGQEDRAAILNGFLQYQVRDDYFIGWPLQILDNKFIGSGRSALVEIVGFRVTDSVHIQFERLNVSNNYCSHWHDAGGDAASTVDLTANTAIVMGNHVKAFDGIASIDFNSTTGVCVGNITTGAISNSPDFPSPTNSFNRN
jgi:parallel beta-helix repeat protein